MDGTIKPTVAHDAKYKAAAAKVKSKKPVSNSGVSAVIENATLGPLAATVKARATPQQWRRIVRTAHQRGFTLDSFLDTSIPAPLKSRTHASLVAEANKSVNTAYAPAAKALNIRDAQIKAVDAKRALDEQSYQSWVIAKQAELQSHAAAADQALLDSNRDVNTQLTGSLTATQSHAEQTAAAAPGGTVTNAADSKPLNEQVPAASALGLGQVANERNLTDSIVGSHADHATAAAQNTLGFLAAQAGKRVASTWQQLSDNATDKQKLALAKGQEAAKEISGLLQNEAVKATNRQANSLVAQRLGLQSDTLKEKTNEFLKTLGLKTQVAASNATHQQNQDLAAAQRADAATVNAAAHTWSVHHPHFKAGVSPQTDLEASMPYLTTTTHAVQTTIKDPNTGKKKIAYKNVPVTAQYVASHRDYYIGLIVNRAKVARDIAAFAVDQFVAGNNQPTWGSGGNPATSPSYGGQ